MSEYISPFRMDSNAVTRFSLKQKSNILVLKSVNVKIGADYKIKNIKKADQDYLAAVDLNLRLDGKHEDKSVFSIEMTMTGIFGGSSQELDEKKFMQMLEINGLTTLMQLSRAYITSVTALSGFGRPVNFPMINVLELVKIKKESLTDSE